MTTIGGGVVAEAQPPKRNALDAGVRELLEELAGGPDAEAVRAAVELGGWMGAEREALPILTGLAPDVVDGALGPSDDPEILVTARRAFSAYVRDRAEALVEAEVERGHRADPLRAGVSMARVRSALPEWAPVELAEGVIARLAEAGRVEHVDGALRRPGHEPKLTADQAAASEWLERVLSDGGLAPPPIEELPPELSGRADLWSLVRRLEERGVVRQVADGLYVETGALTEAASRIRAKLGGRKQLGPADFREVLFQYLVST